MKEHDMDTNMVMQKRDKPLCGHPGWQNAKGTAYLEATLVLPIMLFLFFACVEVGRGVIIYQRVVNAGHAIADMITQGRGAETATTTGVMTIGELNEILGLFPQMLEPYDVPSADLIVSSVLWNDTAMPATPRYLWQFTQPFGGPGLETDPVRSLVSGSEPRREPSDISDNPGERPTGFSPGNPVETGLRDRMGTMRPNENTIVLEIQYLFRPIFFKFFEWTAFYIRDEVFFVPRHTPFLLPPPVTSPT